MLGAGAGGAMGFAQQMAQNPDIMREMLNSPLMQSVMSNPDIFRSLIAENPQMQQLIEVCLFFFRFLFDFNNQLDKTFKCSYVWLFFLWKF